MRLRALRACVGSRGWRVGVAMAVTFLALTSCSTQPSVRTGSGSPTPSRRGGSSPAQRGGSSPGQTATPLANAQTGTHKRSWVLTWSRGFNGPARHPSGWMYPEGGSGWNHKQLQYFTASNAYIDGYGHLILTARKGGGSGYTCWYGPCEYTSVRMQTQGIFGQRYGKFEARIKIPFGRGIWPAFWIKGGQSEIDIIETNSKKPYQVHSGAHAPGMNHTGTLRLSEPVSSNYHVFGVIWNPKGITWTIDGRVYSHLAAYSGWTFNRPFFLILEVAVGGPWPGSPNATTRFPARMSVDWIRVYHRKS